VVIGAKAGHPQLPRIYRAMLDQLLPAHLAPSLDRSVYSAGRGRMWRLPSRRRPDNGRYKIPVAVREVLHRPADELEALTVRPRKGLYWLPDAELSPCQSLVQRYQEAVATVERQPAASAPGHGRVLGDGSRNPGLLHHLFAGRGWLGRGLAPDRWAVVCPWTDAHTAGTPGDTSCVLFAPRAGEDLGWWHCSHMHCADRTLPDVLALFTPDERDQAREQAGLPSQRGRLRATGTTGGLRTVQAARVPLGRTIAASEVKRWQ
jgi:hypothetical protein